jgi:hypothetical protein
LGIRGRFGPLPRTRRAVFRDVLTFTLLVGASSIVAGFLGSLTGLGGGAVVVPLLTMVFGVDIRYAIGAPLISVIATAEEPVVFVVDDDRAVREGTQSLIESVRLGWKRSGRRKSS